jgi:hypothetical protein
MTMRLLFVLLAGVALLCEGCAPPGYMYDTGSLVPHPSDECQRPETVQAIANLLNSKVGLPNGPPSPVIRTKLQTTENGLIHAPTLTCYGLLQTAAGVIGPGRVALIYNYDTPPLPRDAEWETDEDKHRADVAFRNPTPYRPSESSAPVTPKPPKWVSWSQINNVTNYQDVDNIVRHGNIVTIWHLQDFRNPIDQDGRPIPMGPPGKEFQSIKYQIEFDCEANKDRALYFASYSGHMGTGVVVDGGPRHDAWKEIAPGELQDKRLACDIVY